MATIDDVRKRAAADGYSDGLDWDLDGFDSDDVQRERYGWDETTINALGTRQCCSQWGVPLDADGEPDAELWDAACEAYNRAAHRGACAPQIERTGKPPRAAEAQ